MTGPIGRVELKWKWSHDLKGLFRVNRATGAEGVRALYQRVLADGDADLRPGFHYGKDSRAAVVRGVGAQDDHPGRARGSQPVDGPQGVGHDPAGAAGGTGGALAQAGPGDHRCAAGSGDGRC